MKKTIAMLVYPEFTALDLVGPLEVFSGLDDYEVKFVWKNTDWVKCDSGLTVKPNIAFDDCPENIAILFVPGGTWGTVQLMQDEEVLAFLRQYGSSAEFVTSVCTGSLLLGAAGLLQGYKATTHWCALDILKELGVDVLPERVVIDRNRITGGGVTAGIDFGLTLVAKLKGDEVAKKIQLILEYDPAPPFKSGTPNSADPELTKTTRKRFEPFLNAALTNSAQIRKHREQSGS